MTPAQLRRLREDAADRPALAALLELTLVYEATPTQLAALRRADVRSSALVFSPTTPGTTGRVAVRLVPSMGARLASLLAVEPGDVPDLEAPVFKGSPMEIRALLAERFAAVGAPPPRPAGADNVLYIDESEFGVLRVVRDSLGLWALTDVLPQGVVYTNGEPPAHVHLWSYLDALVPERPELLLLGGGAFVGAAYLEERLAPERLDVVEIDPRCLRVAEMYFGYRPGLTTEVHRGDAKAFVREAARAGLTWDAVLQDVADADGTLDWLAEPEHVAAVAAVAPVVLANLIAGLDAPLFDDVERTLRGAGYTEVRRVPLRTWVDRETPQNVLVIATRPA